MGDKIHVKDLHTRDVCIVPWEKEQKYFLYDCFERPEQSGRAVNVRESSDLVWWSESYPVFEPDENFWGAVGFLGSGVPLLAGKVLYGKFLPGSRRIQRVSVPGGRNAKRAVPS